MRATKIATPDSLNSLSNISLDFVDNKVLFRNVTPNEESISYADENVEETADSQDFIQTAGLIWNMEICSSFQYGGLFYSTVRTQFFFVVGMEIDKLKGNVDVTGGSF